MRSTYPSEIQTRSISSPSLLIAVVERFPQFLFPFFDGLDDLINVFLVSTQLYHGNWEILIKFKKILLHRNLTTLVHHHFQIPVPQLLHALRLSQGVLAGGSVLHLFTGYTSVSSDLDIFLRNGRAIGTRLALLTRFFESVGYDIKFYSSIRYINRRVIGFQNRGTRRRIEIIVHDEDDIVSNFDISVCMSSLHVDEIGSPVFIFRDVASIIGRMLVPTDHLSQREQALSRRRLNKTISMNSVEIAAMHEVIRRVTIRITKYCERGYSESMRFSNMRVRWMTNEANSGNALSVTTEPTNNYIQITQRLVNRMHDYVAEYLKKKNFLNVFFVIFGSASSFMYNCKF